MSQLTSEKLKQVTTEAVILIAELSVQQREAIERITYLENELATVKRRKEEFLERQLQKCWAANG